MKLIFELTMFFIFVFIFLSSSCAGQWYLPAGRMEQGETIEVSFDLSFMI